MKPRIKEITIDGFKSIRTMPEPLRLGNVNVLIGANGAGKTNFLAFLQLVSRMVQGEPHEMQLFIARNGFAHGLLHQGSEPATELSGRIEIETTLGSMKYSFVLSASAEDLLVFRQELVEFLGNENDPPYAIDLGSGYVTSRLQPTGNQATHAGAFYLHHLISQWDFRLFQIRNTSETWEARRRIPLADDRTLHSDGGNLIPFLFRLKSTHPDAYARVRAVVRQVAPFFDDFELSPDTLNPDRIGIAWRQIGTESLFHESQLSDGTLRFVCLAALLLQPELPGLIVIDEPELGLHPAAINILSGLLQSAATKTQIIVSTQSVTLLDNFAPEDIVVVDRKDGQSVLRRLDGVALTDWLEDYSIGELWEKNVLGGRPWS